MGGAKGQASKSTKSSENNTKNSASGKGKVTAIQVAFIVDRYLSDNNFLNTRSSFRNEASHLLSKLPVHKAPKSLLSLGDMLDEYICLKEQKVIITQEKKRLDQEQFRVQKLLTGMQDVMNTYNLNQSNPIINSIPPSTAAVNFPVYNNARALMSTSRSSISLSSELTPPTTTTQPTLKKRKCSRDVSGAPLASKRTRSQLSTNPSGANPRTITLPPNTSSNDQQITPLASVSHLSAPVLGSSSVAKCLFNPGPQTPSPSPTDKSLDHQTPPSTNYKKTNLTPQKFTSTNRTVITSETIQVSPTKQVSYYSVERNHCISSPMKTTTDTKRFTTRDHVKGRLDFDGASGTEPVNSETLTSDENSQSPNEDDAFDFELPNLDCLGPDFNFLDLLGDFDLDADQLNNNNNYGSTPESLSGSPDALVDGSPGDHQLLSGMCSTSTEFHSEQDTNIPGPNLVTSVKSVTKCIKVFSPVKKRRSTGGSDHEICDEEQVV
ncbi:uncharacterized protein [Rutidosis leptorrhynchoides]|uniref:uncharacterized protein n=1 Tax=Rutidosis leptorrhynchoides TaxID=125765 RepID=UPI003A9979B4